MAGRPPQLVDSLTPTIVEADFSCDRPIAVGDHLTIEILFHVAKGGVWLPASYDFENETLE
jgi:hypothetical protein